MRLPFSRHLASRLFSYRVVAIGALSVFALMPKVVSAQNEGAPVIVDRAVVRYYSSETGGPAHPQFISARVLAFEAALEAFSERTETARPSERHIRTALDRHIAEQMLSRLPLEYPVAPAELTVTKELVARAMAERVGGEQVVSTAAARQGLDPSEVAEIVLRQAMAAIYIDRAITPLLHPTEEQLREVYRTSAHPFREQRFEDVKNDLARWFIGERLRVAESSFSQAARNRVRVTIIAEPGIR